MSVLSPILVIGWGDTSSAVLPWLAGLAGLIARKLCEVRGGGESKKVLGVEVDSRGIS